MQEQVKLKHGDITDKILHVFYKIVYPQLGYGFLEKVYENASNYSAKPCEGYICGKIMDANNDFVWNIYLVTAKPSQG